MKLRLVLFKIKKNNLKAIFILILNNKKVFLKNCVLLLAVLILIEKATITILYILNKKLSIIWSFILVFQIAKSSLLAKKIFIAFNFLPKFIKA